MDVRSTERRDVDLLVVGGDATGDATGVAAACTAAQSGLRVLLVERCGFCGGGAVAGLAMQERLQPRELPGQAVRERSNRLGAGLDDSLQEPA